MGFLAAADIPAGSTAVSKASIAGMVRDGHSVVSVADATARAQAVTDWPTATGAAISAANPVMVYRQDTDTIEISQDGTAWAQYYGSAGWASYTPAIKQGTTVLSTSSLTARYLRMGNLVHLTVYAILSSTGTASQPINVAAPSGLEPAGGIAFGTFAYMDASVAYYTGLANYSVSAFYGQGEGQTSAFGQTPAFTAASGDRVHLQSTYEI